ncbi:MAG: helix-turn-helix domain-containing protein [Acidimicrobiales bacterium]
MVVSASHKKNRGPIVAGPIINLAELFPATPIRLEPPQVAELVAAYEGGATVNKLAEGYGIDRTTVLAHLRRQGVPKQVRGTLGPDDVKTAVRLYKAGATIESVAHELDIGSSTVGRILNKAGVTMRPRGRRRRSV